MYENKNLVSGHLGEQFKLEMMVPQRTKELTKHQRDFHFNFQSQSKKYKITRRAEAVGIERWN